MGMHVASSFTMQVLHNAGLGAISPGMRHTGSFFDSSSSAVLTHMPLLTSEGCCDFTLLYPFDLHIHPPPQFHKN